MKATSPAGTRAIGAAIARAAAQSEQPLVIALEGELGAGKTTLVGGFLKALGFQGHARSPTYTLIEPYELAGRSVYHLDLYRLTDPHEVEALGLRDLLRPRAVFLIEWPERGAGMLPAFDLVVHIRYDEASIGRDVLLRSHSSAGQVIRDSALASVQPEVEGLSP